MTQVQLTVRFQILPTGVFILTDGLLSLNIKGEQWANAW